MKLITCLGTGQYRETVYVWNDRECTTSIFPVALNRWFQPDTVFVLLTSEAEQSDNWKNLQKSLPKAQRRSIPSGKNEAELWTLFSSITDCLDDNDEVVFDITHAFRSIPVLTFIAAAYLAKAKSIQLKHVLYGAYEARYEEEGVEKAPVFELTPFLKLLDWMYATDQFLETGDARRLAGLLEDTNSTLWRQASSDSQQELPKKLKSLSDTLHQLSQSIFTARITEIPDVSTRLSTQIRDAKGEIERWAQPFSLLLDKIKGEYEPFAESGLQSQRELIEWYIRNGHVIQAITLAREWLISWACVHLGRDTVAERKEVELAVSNASRIRSGKRVRQRTQLDKDIAELTVLLDIWDFVADLRNDVAHCGMNKRPRSSKAIYQQVSEIPELLMRLDTT